MFCALSSLTLLLASLATAASSTPAGGPALELTFPSAHQVQRFVYLNASSHFHVLLTNTSDGPQRVWADTNSWGYQSLSFEITDAAGKTWHVGKKQAVFTRNLPGYLTIAAGDTLVKDVYFGDSAVWAGFPLRKGQSNSVRIRAVFEVAPSPEATQFALWTGRIESNEVEATFTR
jgi:hypothetical protein